MPVTVTVHFCQRTIPHFAISNSVSAAVEKDVNLIYLANSHHEANQSLVFRY